MGLALSGPQVATAAEPQQLPAVEIVMPAPVPGLGVPASELPYVVDSLSGRAMRSENSANLPDLMGLRLRSVSINETQGNPFQPDLTYRGFTASPLLGSPQGLSVFLDGVRINEAFGDIVNWDLVPQAAIDRVTLVPGSNPLYGLNTLGGAVVLRTKSGETHPGTEIEAYGGSFGRYSGQFEAGGSTDGGLHAYSAGMYFDEAGWRDYSPSQLGQFFGKVGRRSGNVAVELSYVAARSNLVGNGVAPESFLEQSRRAIFTRPDQTRNSLQMVTLAGDVRLDDASQLTALAYIRSVRTRTLNGDVNQAFEAGPNDAAGGGTGDDIDSAANNRSDTTQKGAGAALQWSGVRGPHRLAVGAAYDGSRSEFSQTATLGVFDATRAVIETGPTDAENALKGTVDNIGLYLADTMRLSPDLYMTVAGRFNSTRVTLTDEGPTAPALDGVHNYSKFNPSLGLSYQWRPTLNVFGNFTQGNRAPSPIELGCADPLRPCTLPNALASDPALAQVVTRTGELGARGVLAGTLNWSATVFQATSFDDILFVGTTTSSGYFRNFGQTRRRGADLGVSGAAGRWQWSASYAIVVATYQSPACIVSPNNSTRGTSTRCSPSDPRNPGRYLGDDLIELSPGDRIPGIPDQGFKLSLGYSVLDNWEVGAEFNAFASRYVRGNENNRHEAGTYADLNGITRTYLGGGRAAGFAVLNLSTRVALAKDVELFARLANVFNADYRTAGALAQNPFSAAGQFQTNSDDWTRETFYTPGAPRAGWIGLRWRLG